MNAFGVLQLAPSAPRPLLDEVYWLLIAAANDGAFTSDTHARINAINEAYREIIAADAAPGAVVPPPRRVQKRLFGKPRVVVARVTHYQALHLIPAAEGNVLDVAYRVVAGAYAPYSPERERVEEAYGVLRDPESRAKYDKSLGVTPEERAGRALVVSADREAPPVGATAPAREDAAAPAVEPPAAASADPEAPAGATPVPVAVAEPEVQPAAAAVAAPEPSPAPKVPPVRAAPEAVRQRRIIPFGRRGRPRTETVAAAPPPKPDVTAPPPAIREPSAEQTATGRIAALGDDRPAVTPPPSPVAIPTIGVAGGDAAVVFTAGPLRGRQVELGELLEIPAADDIEEHPGRISRYGERFVFRARPDVKAAVNGEPLALPLVFLDDGDELDVAGHTLRFSLNTVNHAAEESRQSS
ncbi:MAG TPA: hypothetical protein VFY79_00720 [Dehalococcoidia bacterium]|nr:hypothetical protein [Dehalococcoidia bacterium]